MKKAIPFILLLLVSTRSLSSAQTPQEIYEEAFGKIVCMLEGDCQTSFREAVFATENAYFSNRLDKSRFDAQIASLTGLARELAASRELVYGHADIGEVEKYAAVFTVMTDTIPVQLPSGETGHWLPFTYDFEDIWGYGEWSNMFVTKLLATRKGNCHSLPYLYKILADGIGAPAHIALAPNHFYIKHQSKAHGWYNTELTSGMFPVDAWLMASGYIHLDAIVNKLYMEALDEKQMLALCLVDLAQGYERKLGDKARPEFVLAVTETALRYYPHYVNALLLQAETKKNRLEYLMAHTSLKDTEGIHQLSEAETLLEEMTDLYGRIHGMGYRRMPEEMYLDWLVSLKAERSKYENKDISTLNANE